MITSAHRIPLRKTSLDQQARSVLPNKALERTGCEAPQRTLRRRGVAGHSTPSR